MLAQYVKSSTLGKCTGKVTLVDSKEKFTKNREEMCYPDTFIEDSTML